MGAPGKVVCITQQVVTQRRLVRYLTLRELIREEEAVLIKELEAGALVERGIARVWIEKLPPGSEAAKVLWAGYSK